MQQDEVKDSLYALLDSCEHVTSLTAHNLVGLVEYMLSNSEKFTTLLQQNDGGSKP